MRLIWTRPAIAIRRMIFERIKSEDPAAAKRIVTRLRDRANDLLVLPHQGRKGRVEGTFELVVGRTPYLLIFARRQEDIVILTILHHARQWPPVADGERTEPA